MKISSAVGIGILAGLCIGLVSLGNVVVLSSQTVAVVRQNVWWIVVLSMLAPLADYLTGVRTTLLGVVTRHPYRHVGGFFVGLSVSLGLFLLVTANSFQSNYFTLLKP